MEMKKPQMEAPIILRFLKNFNGRTEALPMYADQATKSADRIPDVTKS
jgi:hypothetical protein